MKIRPSLKYQSETENESSASRSRLRSESGLRRSASPTRKIAQKTSQTGNELISLPPNAPVRAPCHRPGNLRPGPGRCDLSGHVVDGAGRDLADLLEARPDVDRPRRGRAVEGRVGDQARLRVAPDPVLDLPRGEEERDRVRLCAVRRPVEHGRADSRRERQRRARPLGARGKRRRREAESCEEDGGDAGLPHRESLTRNGPFCSRSRLDARQKNQLGHRIAATIEG